MEVSNKTLHKREREKQYRLRHLEHARKMARSSYRRNSDKRKAYQVEYRKENPEKVRDRDRRYYEVNRDKILRNVKKYREENPEKVAANKGKWQRDNPEKSRALKRKYEKGNRAKINARRSERLRNDPAYRIRRALKERIRVVLARKGARKCDRTLSLTGCTVEFLRGYLAARFKPGMSWENYGAWHIDHRIPCTKFNLLDPDQQRQCFHFSNLQPLWALENSRKRDTMPETHQAELL